MGRIRYWRVIALAMVLMFTLATVALAAQYVGNSNSHKYHKTECKWAQKISPKNKVMLNSANEAISKGYQPCKVCKPPAKD
jgi:hypothetical protein